MLLLVSLTRERAIYLALELDRSWTEMIGVIARLWMLRSRVKSEPLRVMISQLAAFRALTKITQSRDLSFAELPYV